MCGIIGYTGDTPALPILLQGLEALEYRGYDSAGVALSGEVLQVVKAKGRLSALKERLRTCEATLDAVCGIGHTRWATHGAPDDRNSHPHATGRLVLVHNGIIENYAEIDALVRARGFRPSSETDTEVAAALIDLLYGACGDPIAAISQATAMLRGSYAFAMVFADRPQYIYAIRRDSPLVVGALPKGGVIASDVPAVLPHTNRYYRPQDDVIAVLTPERVSFFAADGSEVFLPEEQVEWSVEQAQKNGHPHFMIKEIHDEPLALKRTAEHYLQADMPDLRMPELIALLPLVKRIHIVACGTAMHAGLVGKHLIERLARVPVQVEMASEFRYRSPILATNDLVILLSQSGETADTLAALRLAAAHNVKTLAIVNVVGSSVAREADYVCYTPAGPEIAVASTKAYSVQCEMLYVLALQLALLKEKLQASEVRAACQALRTSVPLAVERSLSLEGEVAQHARELTGAAHLFYIGRDLDHVLCCEASLKLKEISYIHSEAYAAGELKHGTISLIEDGTPVIALLTVAEVAEKMISGIREVRARGARVLAIVTNEIAERLDVPCDGRILLPDVPGAPPLFAAACVLQMLAYHVAARKGLDVDKPRNLAKSVTVE